MEKLILNGNIINKLLLQNEENKEPETKGTTEETPPAPGTNAPKPKPTTASLSDVIACCRSGGIRLSGTSNIPQGVSHYTTKGNDVTVYRKLNNIKAQVIGTKIDSNVINDIIKVLPQLHGVIDEEPEVPSGSETEDTGNTSGVNGVIDEPVSQGGTGDCWIITGVLSLAANETGKAIIQQSITANPDGSVTVNFQGVGVSYTISADEIREHDTDNNLYDAYSNGDNDMLVLELAVEKLVKDIHSGKVKLNIPEDSYEGYTDGSIEGGFSSQLIYFLTGKTSDNYLSEKPRTDRNGPQINFTEQDIYTIFQDALEKGNTALTFGIYDGTHSAQLTNGETYQISLGNGGHALAITNLTETTVTFVNPWDSTIEYTMTWEEFAKLGIGMLTVTDLSGLEVPEDNGDDDVTPPDDAEPVNPVEPDVPDVPDVPLYSSDELTAQGFTQEQISRYFDKTDNGYALKSGITFKYGSDFRYPQEIEITSIEQLREYCGADQRAALKEEGFPDELIDKYFKLAGNMSTGKENYVLDFKYSGYKVLQDGDNTIIRISERNGDEIVITVKPDGTYTINSEAINANEIDADKYTRSDLMNQGFTQEQISRYFDKTDNGYALKSGITFKYGSDFRYPQEIEITSIEQLREYCGADQRAALKEEGFPDELIDKYFKLAGNMSTGKENYVLDFKYSGYKVLQDGDDTIIRISERNGNEIVIRVKPDGTYTELEMVENKDMDPDKPIYSINDLQKQGFNEEELEKYFIETNNGGYVMKNNIRFSIPNSTDGEGTIKITSLEQLKEYCGVNNRNRLKEQGFTDELIDKFFTQNTDITTGKIIYALQGAFTYTTSKNGDNTIIKLLNANGETTTTITVKPDGTYTITDNTEPQTPAPPSPSGGGIPAVTPEPNPPADDSLVRPFFKIRANIHKL